MAAETGPQRNDGPKPGAAAQDNAAPKSNKALMIKGAVVAIVGFLVLIVGASFILGVVKEGALATDSAVLAGLTLLVAGCGVFGYGWTDWPQFSLTVNARWSLIATFVTVVLVVIMALWADAVGNVIWVAISVGALGGLVHELAQSKGTAFIPGLSSSTKDSSGNPAGESYLGGLLGVVLGGAAGLLILTASTGSVTTQLTVTAFSAGVALKGLSDAAASPAVGQKKAPGS